MKRNFWREIVGTLLTFAGIGITAFSMNILPYSVTVNPILLIFGISVMLIGSKFANGEEK